MLIELKHQKSILSGVCLILLSLIVAGCDQSNDRPQTPADLLAAADAEVDSMVDKQAANSRIVGAMAVRVEEFSNKLRTLADTAQMQNSDMAKEIRIAANKHITEMDSRLEKLEMAGLDNFSERQSALDKALTAAYNDITWYENELR